MYVFDDVNNPDIENTDDMTMDPANCFDSVNKGDFERYCPTRSTSTVGVEIFLKTTYVCKLSQGCLV